MNRRTFVASSLAATLPGAALAHGATGKIGNPKPPVARVSKHRMTMHGITVDDP